MPPRSGAGSGAQMSDLAFIGRSVQKKFEGAPARPLPSESSSSDLSICRTAGHGIFKGKVIDYDRSTGFLIEFEDGDREDVTHKTLVRRPRLGSLSPRAAWIACG